MWYTVLDVRARLISNSDKAALLMGFTSQCGTIKKQNSIPNEVSMDCDQCYKEKRVDIVTDIYPVSPVAYFTWSDRGWPTQGDGM